MTSSKKIEPVNELREKGKVVKENKK